MTEDIHPQVAAMPRVKVVCGRDWMRGWREPHYEIGFYYDPNPWPRLGELIYRRCFVIRFHFARNG